MKKNTQYKVGDKLTLSNKKVVTLSELKADGKEANIFEIKEDDSKLARIFKNDLEKAQLDKLKDMLKLDIAFKNITWPTESDILYDDNLKIVGYLMVKINGKTIQVFINGDRKNRGKFENMRDEQKDTSSFLNSLCVINYLTDLVRVCRNIACTLDKLHKEDILFADINAENLMIDENLMVYFIDTDSYQVGQRVSPLYSPGFLAPEILNYSDGINGFLKNCLRTKEHEYFAVATLFFWIFFKGRFPFSLMKLPEGVDLDSMNDPNYKIKSLELKFDIKQIFLGEENEKEKDMIIAIWEFLSERVQKLFEQAFAKPIQNRPSVEEWEKALKELISELQHKKHTILEQLNFTNNDFSKSEINSLQVLKKRLIEEINFEANIELELERLSSSKKLHEEKLQVITKLDKSLELDIISANSIQRLDIDFKNLDSLLRCVEHTNNLKNKIKNYENSIDQLIKNQPGLLDNISKLTSDKIGVANSIQLEKQHFDEYKKGINQSIKNFVNIQVIYINENASKINQLMKYSNQTKLSQTITVLFSILIFMFIINLLLLSI